MGSTRGPATPASVAVAAGCPSAGPAELHRLPYNAAMSAAKTATWKPCYERQRAKGLSTSIALVVLARKLVRVAFALYKHDTCFDPALIGA